MAESIAQITGGRRDATTLQWPSQYVSCRLDGLTHWLTFKPACQRLTRTAKDRGVDLTVLAEDAARAVHDLNKAGAHFDAVIVNPPRRGLDLRVRNALAALAPGCVVYVSCNPNTLARDLSHLAGLGLRTQHVRAFDMMPLTHQVETMAVLSPGDPSGHAILFEDETLLAIDKPPHVAMQDGRASVLEWVHRREGWERAVTLLSLDAESSGVVLFARDRESALPLELALLQCTRRFSVLAKGVTHGKGRIARPKALQARYERTSVIGGHSLLDLSVKTGGVHTIEHQLAVMRHPIIGHAKHGDRRTNQHFSMRHGLDRAFMHCAEVRLPRAKGDVLLCARLAPDLTLALESLSAKHTSLEIVG